MQGPYRRAECLSKRNSLFILKKLFRILRLICFGSYIIAIIHYINSSGGIMNLHHISIKTDPKREKKIARKACVRLEKGFVNFKGVYIYFYKY